MRSVSVLRSLIAVMLRIPFAQTVAERDTLVEDEALAAPTAFGLRDLFEIVQDAALQVVDLGKTLREQVARGLFAADAAGAEHRDFTILRRIEVACGEFLELPKARDGRIDSAVEGADGDLEGVARVDYNRVRCGNQTVPVFGLDIGADPERRIGCLIAECDDLFLQPDLEPAKRHRRGRREFKFQMVETATKELPIAQRFDQFVDGLGASGQCAADPFMRTKQASLQ